MRRDIITSVLAIVVFTVLLRAGLSARRDRRLAGRVLRQGGRQPHRARRQGGRLALIGQDFKGRPALLPVAPVGDGLQRQRHLLQQPRPEQRGPGGPVQGQPRRLPGARGQYNPGLRARTCPSTPSRPRRPGVDPHISEANARIQARRVAEVRGLPLDARARAGGRQHRRPRARLPRRARRERARAEPRDRRGGRP